mgnify:CR=1 FL=1
MKLLSYGLDNRMEPRLAFSLNGQAIDVMRASLWMKENRQAQDFLTLASSMKLILQDWGRSFTLLKQLENVFHSIELEGLSIYDRPVALAEGDIVFFPPVPDPPSLRFFRTLGSDMSTGFNFGNTQTLFGHGHSQPYNDLTTQPELAAIVATGIDANDIQIAGFTIANNWVDIDHTPPDGSEGLSRGIATSLGPYLVTADELESQKFGSGYNLDLELRINGQSLGEGNFKKMSHNFPEMIRQAAKTRVMPGDVFCSGSPLLLSSSPCPTKGDLVEVEIQGLSSLSNLLQHTAI